MLWAEGGPIRWLALLVTTAAIVSTADIPMTILLMLTRNLHISTVGISGQMLTVMLTRPAPLLLLAMGIFYLWIYARRASAADAAAGLGEHGETPLAPRGLKSDTLGRRPLSSLIPSLGAVSGRKRD